ncbi:MAG: hypothetical protein IPP16_02075 [Acidimicrobiaceae bacterium]|nr:hypothetical protein [Acidimicrobiaceae bacterium]
MLRLDEVVDVLGVEIDGSLGPVRHGEREARPVDIVDDAAVQVVDLRQHPHAVELGALVVACSSGRIALRPRRRPRR